jgi:MoxR-like ATPase
LKELVETLDLGMNAILIGPTATGKSLAVFEAKDRLKDKKSFFVIEGHESLKEFDLLGGYVPVAANTYEWRDGVVVQAMKAGGLLFCDEANRMPTRTLNILLGILSRRSVVLTEHGTEQVTARDGFQVVLAMNLGKGYAVNTLDTALVNRFDVTLEFRYLPPDQETDLLVDLTGLDKDSARIMVKVANETRQKRKNKELAGELTPRGLVAWARKYLEKTAHNGKDILIVLKAAAKVTWIPYVAGTDADGYVRDDVVAELLVLIESHTPRR